MATQQIDLGNVKGPPGPQGPAGPAGTDGKRYARFVIGTSLNGWTSADCDYLCDGVNDEEEINAAINALPNSPSNKGGSLLFLDGDYRLKGDITANSYVSFIGLGPKSRLVAYQVMSLNIKNVNNGGFYNIGIAVQYDDGVIYINGSNFSVSNCDIMNVVFQNCSNMRVNCCVCHNASSDIPAIHLKNGGYSSISGCVIQGDVKIENGYLCTVVGNMINADSYAVGLYGTTSYCVVVGNTCYSEGMYTASTANNNLIESNHNKG